MKNAEKQPSLDPSFPLSSNKSSHLVASVDSPAPHLGWYSRGYLPHWDHPGMSQFITFRLGDSLPAEVVLKWKEECAALPEERKDIQVRRRIEGYLDAGHGGCWLNRPTIANLVQDVLLHFDGKRYRLLAWCIMPNHVHTLVETREGFPLDGIIRSWKSFTAHEANKILQREGEFWQRDYFDRYIRDAEHFEKIVAYIEENPVKAGLAKIKTDWKFSSARFRSQSICVSSAR